MKYVATKFAILNARRDRRTKHNRPIGQTAAVLMLCAVLQSAGCESGAIPTPGVSAKLAALTFSPSSVTGGQNSTATIMFDNALQNNLEEADLVATPGGLVKLPDNRTSNCTSGSNCGSFSLNANTNTGSFPVSTNAVTTPTLVTIVASGKDEFGDPLGQATATLMVLPPPDLALAMTNSPQTFMAGSNGAYTLTVTNVGNAATTGTITVTDTLPPGLGFVSNGSGGNGWACSANGQTVTCTNAGPIAASNGTSSFPLTVSVAAAAVPSVTNAATVSTTGDTNAANNSASDPTTVTAAQSLDLALAIAPSPASFTVGTNGVYTLTVTNVGNGATTGTITVTDTLPNGLNFVSSSGTSWRCSANAQVVTCTNPGPIAANNGMSAVMLTVSVAAAAVPSVTDMATVSTPGDNNAANNMASDPTTVNAASQGPSLSVNKTHGGNFAQGQLNVQYTVTVSNAAGAGPTDGSTVTATEIVPSGLSLVNIFGTGWNCSISSKSCTRTDALQPGNSYPAITVIVNVSSSAPASVTNQVTVSGGGSANGNGQDVTSIDVPAGKVSILPTAASFVLTHGNTGQFVAVVSNDKGGGATYQLVQNGIPCAPACGTLTPSAVPGQGVTYAAPAGIPMQGIAPNIVATSVDFPNENASGGISVIPCNAFTDLLCGQHSLFIQGYKNNGSAAVAAASFTATGLANGLLQIVDGVMDINDEDGLDPGRTIVPSSYSFDPTTFTGTITLVNDSLVPSHNRRTYVFTAGNVVPVVSKFPILEHDSTGFQGSGFLALLGPGPFGGFPSGTANQGSLNVKIEGQVADFNQPNQPPHRQGLVGLWKLGQAGATCISSGATDVVANRYGTVTQLGVQGPCTASDPATGRGTFTMGVANPGGGNVPVNPEEFAFYFTGRNEVALISTTADVLGGMGEIMNSSINFNSLNCGILFGPTGIENCVVATSGGSKSGGNDVTLTLGQVTCPTPGNPASCHEILANGTVTGSLGITQDQVAAGSCNGSAPGAACGQPQTLTASYNISSTTGVGYICVAASCPNGATDANALTYASRFLLANDKSAAVGDLFTQSFLTSSAGTLPIACAGSFFGAGTTTASSPIVPNIIGPLTLKPDNGCAANDPFTGSIAGSLEASGASNGQMVPAPFQDPLSKITSGTFQFNKGEFASPGATLTGRGTAATNGASPEPTGYVFYEANPNDLFFMQTDNPINGGQALLHLRGASDNCYAVFITPSNLSVPAGGSTTTTIAVQPCPNTDLSTLQLNVSGPQQAGGTFVPLPNGVTGSFSPLSIDPATGTALSTLTLSAAAGTPQSTNNQLIISVASNPDPLAAASFAVVP